MTKHDDRARADDGDPARDFEDAAPGLWSLIGEAPEHVPPAAFVERTLGATRAAGRRTQLARRPFLLGGLATAATIFVAVGIFLRARDAGPSRVPAAAEASYGDVVEFLDTLDPEDLLALEVEVDEAVNEEWFGG